MATSNAKKKRAAARKAVRSAKKKATTKSVVQTDPSSNTIEISTVDFKRPTVKVDGKPYAMRTMEEFTVDEYVTFIEIGEQIDEMRATPGANKEHVLEVIALMRQQIGMLLLETPPKALTDRPALMNRVLIFFGQLARPGGRASEQPGAS